MKSTKKGKVAGIKEAAAELGRTSVPRLQRGRDASFDLGDSFDPGREGQIIHDKGLIRGRRGGR